MQCTGHDIQAQPINFCILENCEPNSRQWVTSVQKLTTDRGPDQSVMIVPQGKSPVENQMAVGATFKIVTFVLRSGSHLVRDISQKGPTHLKSLPIIMTIPLRFSFDPLGKIICADEQILFVSQCFRERTYNIQTPLSKRPRAGKRIKNSPRLVNVWSESLTLVIFSNIFLRFFLHAWPPVSLGNGPVRQGSSPV